VPATNLLADICLERGQRALVGRVCMDALGPAGTYRDESAAEALKKTRQCVDHVRSIDAGHALVTPVITPRFAPACSAECLAGLGELARETGYPVQTHISENVDEVALVRKLFPERASYTDVYDHAGLLTERMILAHAIHLTADEVALVKARGAKISHCPSSNTALTSGCARVRKLMDGGIDVGLGTDVSGGFSASVLEVARHAIWVSRYVAMTEGEAAKLSVEDALYIATRGGAKVVGQQDKIGGFDVGMEWDAQLIVLNPVGEEAEKHGEHEPPVDVFGWEVMEDRIHKWVYGGDDRNTTAVWVKGRLVHSTSRFKS
jgi:guanine deaminase